ncbi:hypothetical protein ACU686_30885 [Yinghuangia aomiensis]
MEARNPRRWRILIVLCPAPCVLVVDSMALTVAVPAMTEDLRASAQQTQWILVLLRAGLRRPAADLGEPRRPVQARRQMLIGLVLFGVASLAALYAAEPGRA